MSIQVVVYLLIAIGVTLQAIASWGVVRGNLSAVAWTLWTIAAWLWIFSR